MASIGGMLGLSGGVAGTGMAGPQGTNIGSASLTPGTNAAQIGGALGGAQNSLQSQQALLAALQAQNGMGNQSQVYNQLQGVANGTGPNPAQAQLAQATGANVANQAAMMAGQRGAGSNVGLMARQAGQQGAGIQQNAAGQAATMQAQQSLNALGAMGNMANQQVANQIGATGANTQANQSEQQLLQNALAQQNQNNVAMQSNVNNANVGMQGNINSANAGMANTTMQGQQGLVGGVMNGIGGAAGMSDGGSVPGMPTDQDWANYAATPQGAPTPAMGAAPVTATPAPVQSSFGNFMMGQSGGGNNPGAQALKSGASRMTAGIGALFSSGGDVGEKLKSGGAVPGKAKVPGNSPQNDTVKAKLSPGEQVIDRETMADPGPAGQAARFVAAAIAQKKARK